MRAIALSVIAVLLFSGHAFAKTVSLPITIDYPLLGLIIKNSVFTDPGETAVALDENNGCQKITLSEPQAADEGRFVRLKTRVKARAGAYLFNKCVAPVEWEGYIEVVQEVRFDDDWVLRFRASDSRLYNSEGSPARLTGIIYSLIKTYVHAYLDQIEINLAPPVTKMKKTIAPFFGPQASAPLKKLVKSFRPGKIRMTKDAVRMEILAETDESADKREDEKKLGDDERERFTGSWEAWDSFLAYLLTSLPDGSLPPEDQQILLDTLLDMRSRFITGLAEHTLGPDFVRDQFTDSWTALEPVFRKRLDHGHAKSALGYLAFFTSSDALVTLDKIGFAFGVEISRNGLLRLARLLADDRPAPLTYSGNVDTKLRKSLGLGEPLDEGGPSFDEDELDLESVGVDKTGYMPQLIDFLATGMAWADTSQNKSKIEMILKWVATKKNLTSYLQRARRLIDESAAANLKKSSIPKKYHQLYRFIVPATAWQESCFRQFKKSRGKVTYLRSYNNTSVGIMQINERVWRGIYNPKSLRWNIRYNAMAGAEIADIYLRRYALRKMNKSKPLSADTLARAVYAMYNGGPGQFRKFLKRSARGKFYLSDRLFRQKYLWVKKNRRDKMTACFAGM
ncbi:MAG TPA: lytic transglycosylase domain-containing protein [Nitrospirae bacterium]|nr:lytic transglycosylase domain-containing protein [Nitrospirota bacterium]